MSGINYSMAKLVNDGWEVVLPRHRPGKPYFAKATKDGTCVTVQDDYSPSNAIWLLADKIFDRKEGGPAPAMAKMKYVFQPQSDKKLGEFVFWESSFNEAVEELELYLEQHDEWTVRKHENGAMGVDVFLKRKFVDTLLASEMPCNSTNHHPAWAGSKAICNQCGGTIK